MSLMEAGDDNERQVLEMVDRGELTWFTSLAVSDYRVGRRLAYKIPDNAGCDFRLVDGWLFDRQGGESGVVALNADGCWRLEELRRHQVEEQVGEVSRRFRPILTPNLRRLSS